MSSSTLSFQTDGTYAVHAYICIYTTYMYKKKKKERIDHFNYQRFQRCDNVLKCHAPSYYLYMLPFDF